MDTRRPDAPYVEGALITGPSAHVLDRILASPNVVRMLAMVQMPAEARAEVDAARRAIRRAAQAFEAASTAVDGTTETSLAEIAPLSSHEFDTHEAAALLGVGERRVRQLAAGGMGRRAGGRWLLDRTAVLAYAERRRPV